MSSKKLGKAKGIRLCIQTLKVDNRISNHWVYWIYGLFQNSFILISGYIIWIAILVYLEFDLDLGSY